MNRLTRSISLLLLISLLICSCSGFCFATDIPTYTTGDQTIDMIERYEGFSPTPYTDSSGTYIGFGSRYEDAETLFGKGVSSITREQARTLTRYQLTSTEQYMNSFLVKNEITVNQNQFDALMDFTYNVGIGWTTYRNPDGSWCQLKQMLLDGPDTWTYDRVHSAFGAWSKSNGVVLPGLAKRRSEEADLFLTPVDGTVTPAPSSGFYDVSPDAWYYDQVSRAVSLGLMRGNGDGTFTPEAYLTRAQVVTILANLEQPDLSLYCCPCFRDVDPNAWYGPAVAWAASEGYIYGIGDNLFAPDNAVTREDLCTIIVRYLNAQNISLPPSGHRFADDADISEYARDAVYSCYEMGIIHGRGDNLFAPKAYATRAEAATILCNLYDYMS